MKKLLILAFALLISVSFIMPVNAGQKQRQKQNKQQQKQQRYQKNKQPRYYGQGYRYNHHGTRDYRPKHYRGHWRSWNEWESHRKYNRQPYRNGRYYRENNNLYFEFENEDGRFVFSIGK